MTVADADRIALRFQEEAVFGTTPGGDVTATITTTEATRTYSAAAGLDVFSVGQTILIAGLAQSASNGYKTVTSASATNLVVDEDIGTGEGPVASVTLKNALNEVRLTGESLGQATAIQESQEIRDDRQVADVRRTNRNAEGDISYEFSYGAFDKFLEAALMASAWSTAVTITTDTLSMASGDNSINDAGGAYAHTASLAITGNDTITRDAGSWVTDGFRDGMVITCSSSEDAGNDGDWTITAISALVITIGAGGLTNNAADTAMDIVNAGGFVTDGYAADQWIRTSGFTTAANNDFYKIVSVAAGKMVLEGNTCVTEAAGDSVTVLMGEQITNGTTQHYYTLEREYTDVDEFALYTGMQVDTWTLDTNSDGIITGTFGWIGKDETSAAATESDGTAQSAASNLVYSAIDDVDGILEALSDKSLKAFTISLANNLRPRNVIGTLGPESIGVGRVTVTGTFQKYFESEVLMDKYLNFTPTTLTMILDDNSGSGNAYVIDMPEVKFTNGRRVAGGTGQDIMADMEWSAFRDSSEDVTIRIARFPE